MNKALMTLAVVLGLVACGGGEDTVAPASPIQLLPAQIADVDAPEVSRLLGDRREAVVAISFSTTKAETLQRNAAYDVPGFKAYGMVNSNLLLFQAEGASGTAELSKYLMSAYVSSPLGANAQTFFGTIPVTGKASYSGDYVGMLTANYGSTVYGSPTQHYLTGDVALSADFEAGIVSGAITNRQRFGTGDSLLLDRPADIALSQIDLTNGTSSAGGLTSGGEYSVSAFVVQPEGGTHQGSWNVVFGGADAAEAFGRVEVLHDHDQSIAYGEPNDYTETGVFYATKK